MNGCQYCRHSISGCLAYPMTMGASRSGLRGVFDDIPSMRWLSILTCFSRRPMIYKLQDWKQLALSTAFYVGRKINTRPGK